VRILSVLTTSYVHIYLQQELETILLDGGGSLEVACDVVFKVKSLLAFESRYNTHMENKAGAR
jgi:hypothetical protein